MKRIFLAALILAMASASSFAGVIVIKGTYHGKNLFVQNPFASSGVGYCTIEVQINGKTTTDEINSSAFEIDFTYFQIPIGSEVEVKIKHKDDCKPRVVNEEVMSAMSTFEIDAIKVDRDGSLFVVTKNETGALPYTVQQFRWNKWVDIGTIEGKGSPDKNEYTYQIPTIHSGENKFRLKQVDATNKPRYSFDTKFKSPIAEVQFSNPGDGKKAGDKIGFTDKTMYEIYNEFGVIVDKGIAKDVNVANLEKGTYWVNFDNKFASFKK